MSQSPIPAQGVAADPVARQMAARALDTADQALTAVPAGLSQVRFASAKTLAVVALGGTTDVTVVWNTPMPNPGYTVEAVSGPGLIGAADLSVASQTTTGCVITVRATLAVAAGAVVFAHAYQ